MTDEFINIANLLGHDIRLLEAGEEAITKIKIPTLEEGAVVLSRATHQQRQLRGATFFDAIKARQKLGQGMHDRGEAVTFANGIILATDAPGLARHLPIRVKAISVKEKTVKEGTCWDVSTRGHEWNVDNDEELYCIVNIDTLILEQNASLIIRGNVFSLVCQNLIKSHPRTNSDINFDIGIHPTPYSYLSDKDCELDGENGIGGLDGQAGQNAQDVPVSGSLFGIFHLGESKGSVNGEDGFGGQDGKAGENGSCGGSTKLAEITLRNIVAPKEALIIEARAGRGGTGGDGGKGGDGGSGGNGAAAYRTLAEDYPAGRGGAGGAGGNGGAGGKGGNGGISSNIYINTATGQENYIKCIRIKGAGGHGGKGGADGTGGKGGRGGLEPDGSFGPGGVCGQAGRTGQDGRNGHDRSAPPVFINEKPILC